MDFTLEEEMSDEGMSGSFAARDGQANSFGMIAKGWLTQFCYVGDCCKVAW